MLTLSITTDFKINIFENTAYFYVSPQPDSKKPQKNTRRIRARAYHVIQ